MSLRAALAAISVCFSLTKHRVRWQEDEEATGWIES